MIIPQRTIYAETPKTEKEQLVATIVEVAKEKGIKPSHLLGQAYTESRGAWYYTDEVDLSVKGDGVCSHGILQINICKNANPEAKSIIGNLRKELEWAADKLISYGYKEGRITNAFSRYNAPKNGNLKYAKSVLEASKQFIQYDTI